MKWNARERESGFSVVEVLVAVVILAVVLAWNAQMTESVLLSDQRAQLTMVSLGTALTKAEELRRAGYEARSGTAYRGDMVSHGAKITWTAKIDTPEDANLAVVEIAVDWKKGTRSGKPRTYRTLMRMQ